MSESATDSELVWHPVAASTDLPYRHTFHGQLAGRELVLWRADDHHVNVWDNRCLHRGVRLSIGLNDGRELQCRYHGWRYANQTAGCTYIPAHPADAPARTISCRVFPAVERYGLVWTTEHSTGEVGEVELLSNGTTLALRALPVNASAELVLARLRDHTFQPNDDLDGDGAQMCSANVGSFTVALSSTGSGEATNVVYFVQPVDASRSIVRSVMAEALGAPAEARVLRHHNTRLTEWRDATELVALQLPTPEVVEPKIEEVPIHLAGLPEPAAGRRHAALRVAVARKWMVADEVAAFELVSIGDPLPTLQPGAHIDVHLPGGLVRQYSLTNGPGELGSYRIGVKLEPDSRGGSSAMHESVREGDVLAISEPRNNFALRRDALRTVLIAGGIGITPLLAMTQSLHHSDLNPELHYFARSHDHVAFRDVLADLGGCVNLHIGLDPEETGTKLTQILIDPGPSEQIYACGPGPMLEAIRRVAAAEGWPDDAVHFEYFKNPIDIDDTSAFEVDLARSALTLKVGSGQSILDVLHANGVPVDSSCEQGACGTCAVGVIEGAVDHQDVYLTDAEKSADTQMMVCVSRAQGSRLVLDV